MFKLISTSDLIKKLQEYEKENGVGAISSISSSSDEYTFTIVNDSDYNKHFSPAERKEKYKVSKVKVLCVDDDILFPAEIDTEEGEKIPCSEKSCHVYNEESCSCTWKANPSLLFKYINDDKYAEGICPLVKEALENYRKYKFGRD